VALCLWLGDNGVALSMVKRAQYSNTIFLVVFCHKGGQNPLKLNGFGLSHRQMVIELNKTLDLLAYTQNLVHIKHEK
jgi:hypothetical protein